MNQKRLIMLAHPRSCSTYLMNQFTKSRLLDVCERRHHELISQRNRYWTRMYLGLPKIKGELINSESWSNDEEYVREFFRQHPNGAFKVILRGHMYSFVNFLANETGAIIVKVWRKDEASALASMISKLMVEKIQTEALNKAWLHPARQDYGLVHFSDITKYMSCKHYHDDRFRRLIEKVYYYGLEKCRRSWNSVQTPYTFYAEDFHSDWSCPQLEDELEMTFNFSDYITPSHYSEIFDDWELFEKELRSVIGPVPGLPGCIFY